MLKDMKEEIIKFETAKLAKEKGFCLNTNFEAYVLEDLFQEESPSYKIGDLIDMILEWESEFFVGDKIAYAPTQTLLQKYLREKNIFVCVDIDQTSTPKFCYSLCRYKDDEWENMIFPRVFSDLYRTYEEALEEGLLEALKLI